MVFKPRGHWHLLECRSRDVAGLEIITPGGLEQLFRRLGQPDGEFDPETLPALAAEYGCEVDIQGTMPLVARHGLTF